MNELDQIKSEMFDSGEKAFLQEFQAEWTKQIHQLYCTQVQLLIGNHIRPRLVYWGYCAGRSITTLNEMFVPVKIAVIIELIHKASILLDDYIDGDIERRGEKSFWVEYGEKRTMLFVLHMIGRAIQLMNELCSQKEILVDDYLHLMRTLTDTMESMSIGVLEELDLNQESQFDIKVIEDIINKETSTLLSNSLLFGYYASGRHTLETLAHIELIGRKCGYMFQTMNDLEPLCQAGKSAEYKGQLNTDFASSRKNIGIAYLFPQLTASEKICLLNAQQEKDNDTILYLVQKHGIVDQILSQMELVYLDIVNLISAPEYSIISRRWKTGFSGLISRLYQLCLERLKNGI